MIMIVITISNRPAPKLIDLNPFEMCLPKAPTKILASPTTNRAPASMRINVKISRPGFARTTADSTIVMTPNTISRALSQPGPFNSLVPRHLKTSLYQSIVYNIYHNQKQQNTSGGRALFCFKLVGSENKCIDPLWHNMLVAWL